MRPAKRYTYKGEALTVAEWAARAGISPHTMWRRIRDRGWPNAITAEIGPPTHTFAGKTLTVREWAAELGGTKNMLRYRLRQDDWPIEAVFTKPPAITPELRRQAALKGIMKRKASR